MSIKSHLSISVSFFFSIALFATVIYCCDFVLFRLPSQIRSIFSILYILIFGSSLFYGLWFHLLIIIHCFARWNLISMKSFQKCVRVLSHDFLGRFMHGFEVRGWENLPKNSQYLFVGYHGKNALPDCTSFVFAFEDRFKVRPFTVCLKFFRNSELYKYFFNDVKGVEPTRQACIDCIRSGNHLLLYPGGYAESSVADNDYLIHWPEGRIGFAHIAMATDAVVVPLFTRNINEVGFNRRNIKLPFFLNNYKGNQTQFGMFPVKLTTYIGKPIRPSDFDDAESLAAAVKKAITDLRDQHQTLPGSIVRGLMERFTSPSVSGDH